MREAVIVDGVRTPVGRAFKGSLIEARPDDMAGFIVAELMKRLPEIDPATVDDVVVGCAMTSQEAGFNLGRRVALLAGLPDTVPGATVNRFCASSLQSIRMAFHAIRAGEGDVFVAAGVDSITRIQSGTANPDWLNPRFTDPTRPDFINLMYQSMGITAENVARERGITRRRMDEFAKRSQDAAVEAREAGYFDREIVPYPLPDGTVVTRDDSPRPGTTLEKLAELPPAFTEDGTVTAGNACPLNDGAAAVMVVSQERADALGLRPRARVVASAVTGLAPEVMGLGPIEAVGRVLSAAGMSIGDIDLVELNEAFAAQVLAVAEAVGIEDHQLNPHGGAIAIGHPFGMTGARIMTTLLNGLETRDQTIGLETMCVGGGQGMAMIVERLT
jgi:acetyl-CoA C-acetyltransferase